MHPSVDQPDKEAITMKPFNLKEKIFVAAQIAQAQGEAWAEWLFRTYSCDMDCGDPDNDTTEMIGGHWRDCNVNYQPKGGLSELHDRWVSEGGDPGRGPSLSSRSDHVEWSIDFGSLDSEVGNPLFFVSIRVGSFLMSRWSSWDPEMWATTPLAPSIRRADQKEAIRLSEAAEDRIAKLEAQCSVDPDLVVLHIQRSRIVDRIVDRFMVDKPDDADVRDLKLKSLEIHDLIRARNPDEDDEKVKESGRADE